MPSSDSRFSGRVPCVVTASTLLLCLITGCARYGSLPTVSEAACGPTSQPVRHYDCILHWHGSRRDLRTYWGRQHVRAVVSVRVPATWTEPSDAVWEVRARNHEDKPLPFLGTLDHYRNENGTRLSQILPAVDLESLPDGLYTVIDPNAEKTADDQFTARPVLYVCEVRGHAFKPFRARVPLQKSASTNLPDAEPPADAPPRAGTPFPMN